jgi:phage N-6-adenine-methyltransferase
MKKTGPSINRGGSNQSYETPPEFMEPVQRRFGRIAHDLACEPHTRKAECYYTKEDDALKQNWCLLNGWLWLNPEYSDIGTWAKKCAEESQLGAKILFLVPASTGSGWYWNYVKPYAHVLHLRHRITFLGATDAYPKDLILAVYAFGLTGESPWSWLTPEAAKMVKERTTKRKASAQLESTAPEAVAGPPA